MKCCKKMVLVPEDQCNLLLKDQVHDIPPAVKKSVQLDDHMSQLLDDASAPKNHTKAKEFEKLFRDYMHYRNHDTIPSFTQSSPAKEAAPPDMPAASGKHQPLLLILAWFGDIYPTCIKQKGRLLLHHLRNADVNCSNKGELISRSGDVIPGSNAVDLVKEALVGCHRMKQNYGESSGWGAFLQTLREANVSRSLFGKKKTLRQLQQSQQMKYHPGKYGDPRDEEPKGSPYHGQVPDWLTLE